MSTRVAFCTSPSEQRGRDTRVSLRLPEQVPEKGRDGPLEFSAVALRKLALTFLAFLRSASSAQATAAIDRRWRERGALSFEAPESADDGGKHETHRAPSSGA